MTVIYEALPMRVLFGTGSLARLGEETSRLGLRRVVVLTTPRQRELGRRVAAVLGDSAVGIHDQARMHVPVPIVTDAAEASAKMEADGYVAAGGGSTIGLAKALALRTGMPYIALPTTYAGSEMTPVWGLTESARKRTGRDRTVLPKAVIYDPALTRTVPPSVAAVSGLNAIAHAVESLYAPDTSPVVAAMAERGIRDLASALPALAAGEADDLARAAALTGAWLCGACLGSTTMGLHHKLCHVLGGLLDLPHAATHAVVLPYVAAFNLPAAPDADAAVRRALDVPVAADGLRDLASCLGAPHSLAELGVERSQLGAIARETLSSPYANPRPIDGGDLAHLLEEMESGSWR